MTNIFCLNVGDQQRSDSKQKDVRLSNIIAAKGKFLLLPVFIGVCFF